MKIVPDLASSSATSPPRHGVGRTAREPRIEDLLGRHEVLTDLAAVRRALEGRRVLVTGAGGSIGSEICRQVASAEPEVLIMVDHDETHLHDVGQTGRAARASRSWPTRPSGRAVFEVSRGGSPRSSSTPAAHKHVPILETHVVEAVTTNVLGTSNVLELRRGPRRAVRVHLDRQGGEPGECDGRDQAAGRAAAVRHAPEGHAYCAVRFGNVLGSRGSVIPTFRRQIAAGGPVTVTDPHMTRYFMSVEEAVQLVLQAAVLAERGDVYMLEMGEPLSILELAHRMIRLSGLHPGTDIQIRIIGPRRRREDPRAAAQPGERLVATEHPSILRLERSPRPEDPEPPRAPASPSSLSSDEGPQRGPRPARAVRPRGRGRR